MQLNPNIYVTSVVFLLHTRMTPEDKNQSQKFTVCPLARQSPPVRVVLVRTAR